MVTMAARFPMQAAAPRVRLFLDQGLENGAVAVLARDRTHYLKDVMRLGPGDGVAAFNGRDGEWLGRIEAVDKRRFALRIERLLRPQPAAIDLWIAFAPLKRGPTDLLVTKAVELGATTLVPVATAHTTASRVRSERMKLLAIEAAEQCGRCDVPDIHETEPLPDLLERWPAGRRLVFCDESGHGRPIVDVLTEARDDPTGGPWAVLIGPEGGFTEEERARLRSRSFVHAVDLGPRLLRAETAAIAALVCWQAVIGDWRGPDSAPARQAAARV